MRVAWLLLFLGMLGPAFSQQQSDQLLHQRIPSIYLSSPNIGKTLISLAGDYKVPVGNEISSVKTNESIASQLEVKNLTVGEIFDALLRNNPDYRWQLKDGVINISSNSAPEPLLDAVIGEFRVKDQTVNEIREALEARPEVQRVLSETATEFQELTILPGGNAESKDKYSFDLQNTTVRQILNRLILQTEGHYWSLVRLGNQKRLWLIVR